MNKMLKQGVYGILLFSSALAAQTANADVGIGLRAGTFGYGADFNVGMTEKLTLRLAYNYFSYDQTIEDTDVTYDGTLKISSFSGFLDWHVFGGGFKLSIGAVGGGPKIDVDGTPAPGEQVEINGRFYDRSELGSLRGDVKMGSSIAPYVGIGYGNVVSEKHRVTFLFDLGTIYGGTPSVKLTATCGAAIVGTQACTDLQNDVQQEANELKADMSNAEWYPVINIGIGIRF